MKKLLTLLTLPIITFGTPATAQETHAGATGAATGDPSYLSLGLGIFDVFDDDEATDFRLEYRDGTPVLWRIKPYVGGELTTDGSVWAGGGLYADFYATNEVVITPSWGVGLYNDGSSDLDLDYPLQFRAQIEAAYQFYSGSRLGVSYNHTSNYDLGDTNPGTDTIGVYYHLPIRSLF